ncbi:MAG: DUF167 domain-containing protein [Thermoplasmata archaeon]|nr:DUF167 domain-containing protein [Thermoplasmata archaeon]
MPSDSYIRESTGGCVIDVDVSPGAKKTEVVAVNEWRGSLQVRVAAEPKRGKANDELLRFLSERLSLGPNAIRIVKGARSRIKTVFVRLSAEEAKKRLGPL